MDETVKSLLTNMFEGENYLPPASCEKAFSENFDGAMNIEWAEYEDHLEVLFYKENLEHLALFSKDGILQEYRKTLPEGFLPYNVRMALDERGEIMNRVLINKGNSILYEVIFRDKAMKRYLALITDLGKVVKELKL